MRLDESSYSPGAGAMGTDHPIAWAHEFDGGRAWYTGLGHQIAMYGDPRFTQHLLGGIRWAAGVTP
jgi:type 1 glutamine amidotransferase